MVISASDIKNLRAKSGAGMLDCKKALLENNGDFEKALNSLRQKGLVSAEKKLNRATKAGIVTSYIHTGRKGGVLLELNCETDFVAKRVEFLELSKTLAMQVMSSQTVEYISLKDIPKELWLKEKEIEEKRPDVINKPESLKESIVNIRVEKTLKTYTLLDQRCIRDPQITVDEYIKSFVALLRENIQVSRFTKFIIGNSTSMSTSSLEE